MQPGTASMQVGQVVAAQPAYAGAYGGSFCGPTGHRSSSAVPVSSPYSGAGSTSAVVAPAASQPVMIRRLNSQTSASSLSMQPALVATSQGGASTPVSRGLPAAYATILAGRSEVAEVVAAEEVLLQTRLLRQGGNEELLQAEVETLRRSVAAQEDKMLQLARQLQVSQENERKLAAELEVARGEMGRLSEDLRSERLGREQAEAAVTEAERMQMAAPGGRQDNMWQGNSGARNSAGRTRGSKEVSSDRLQAQERTPNSTVGSIGGAGGLASGRRGSARPQSAKDEIDGRLREYLERSECGLLFRRLNRGWYSFRIRGERGPPSNDASVEISIVNGKLMARLEPSTHDAGWNNGKLGTIERFVAAMMTA